ncbi:zinc-dependent metalloprotease family protein [Ravibacter arvi]|uniref:Zinc-dependent metalloprotease family protein n=1 Tax=Ravibacter arvi TaxID=2051041 RepID=A0ABP8MCU4_9BACT
MKAVFTILFALSLQLALAQTGFFTKAKVPDATSARIGSYISRFSLFQVHTAKLKFYLKDAPLEFSGKRTPGIPLEVPLPDGTVAVFDIFESPILAAHVARKHPEIRTYAGKGRQNPRLTIRINFTSSGFSAVILGAGDDTAYFEKLKDGTADSTYKCYFAGDAVSPAHHKANNSNNRCGVHDSESLGGNGLDTHTEHGRIGAVSATGATLRTFKLAMAATAEFTAQKGNGIQIEGFNALTNYVNNLNAVYRQELSIAFSLVSDETLVYTDAANDPYSNDDQDAMLDQNQANLDAIFGSTGYDIGHVLGTLGGSGGGVAVRPSVCDDATKGQGVSGVGDGNFPEVFDFQLVAHEIGHQFGMSHTYNSNVPVCTTRAFETSVEPGAGTTIMSYGFTCSNTNIADGMLGDDDYETPYAPFLNFHAVSLEQANAYVATLSCFTETATGNAVPAIAAMTALHTVPRSTPFVLEGQATDADPGDVLSYSWEGTSISDESDKTHLTATTISDAARPPFFRSYVPVQATESNPGRRFYPRLSAVLDGSNYAKGDKLPSVGIITTHALTVRDSRGGVTRENVTVTIDGGSGPFLVTDDPSGTHEANSQLAVKWSVNGTTAAPVSCTLVDILLSTDGGLTFSTLLASGLPNSGSASVVLPNINTTTARIKVAPSTSTDAGNVPNIFFDISNQDFTIENAMPVELISFEVTREEPGNVQLSWKTTQEVNNLGFDIEMSLDARGFLKAGFVPAIGKNTVNLYRYTIGNLLAGTYYFRLKQIDYDGKYAYSPVRRLKLGADGTTAEAYLYPNPAGNTLRINSSFYGKGEPRLEILDLKGVSILIPVKTISRDHCEADVSSLAPGVYILSLTTDGLSQSLKFIKK